MQYRFPENFWQDSACSTLQIEGDGLNGGKSQTMWDMWSDRQPGRFHQGVGPATTSTFYQHWKQDTALLKQLKHNGFRTSLSQSRLIPDGTSEVNPEAIKFYDNVIDKLLAQGITPFITLFRSDMPMVMQKKGGWENHEVVEAFDRHAQTCFTLFGNRVKHWFTFNEPIIPVEGDCLYDFHYPSVVDFKHAATVTCRTILTHSTVAWAYRAANHDGEISVVLNLTPSYPRSQNPADVKAAHYADLLFSRGFLDPVLKGEHPADLVELLKENNQLLACQPDDNQLVTEGRVDLLGINYYQPCRVRCHDSAVNPDAPLMPEWLFDYHKVPERKTNPYRGWEIYESGIYDVITNLRDNCGNPHCFISENGMGVESEQHFTQQEQINDNYRIEFVSEHLKWLHKGISEGYNCLGYHMWTSIDNWLWLSGYKNRYGFAQLDLAT